MEKDIPQATKVFIVHVFAPRSSDARDDYQRCTVCREFDHCYVVTRPWYKKDSYAFSPKEDGLTHSWKQVGHLCEPCFEKEHSQCTE